MSDDNATFDAARVRAIAARSELRASADDLSSWLSPGRLKAEAAMAVTQQIDEAKGAIKRSVTRHPLVAWPTFAAVAGVLVFLLRRPVASMARNGFQSFQTLRKRVTKRKKIHERKNANKRSFCKFWS